MSNFDYSGPLTQFVLLGYVATLFGDEIRFDPQAMKNAKRVLKDIQYCKGPYDVAKNSDCLVIVTEWNEFKELDFKKIKRLLKQPLIIDGRNIYDPKKMKRLGFKYLSIGRVS